MQRFWIFLECLHRLLSLFFLEQYLFEMMPPYAAVALEPHFNRARAVLNERRSTQLGDWTDKVRVVPESQNLLPPPSTSLQRMLFMHPC